MVHSVSIAASAPTAVIGASNTVTGPTVSGYPTTASPRHHGACFDSPSARPGGLSGKALGRGGAMPHTFPLGAANASKPAGGRPAGLSEDRHNQCLGKRYAGLDVLAVEGPGGAGQGHCQPARERRAEHHGGAARAERVVQVGAGRTKHVEVG